MLLSIWFWDGNSTSCELISLSDISSIESIETTAAHAPGTQSFSYVIHTENKMVYFS